MTVTMLGIVLEKDEDFKVRKEPGVLHIELRTTAVYESSVPVTQDVLKFPELIKPITSPAQQAVGDALLAHFKREAERAEDLAGPLDEDSAGDCDDGDVHT